MDAVPQQPQQQAQENISAGPPAQHQQQQEQQQQQQEQEQEGSSSSSGHAAAPGKSRLRRLIRIGIAAIRTVLVLELLSIAAAPLITQHLKSRQRDSDEADNTDSDLDPADVLMDYLTGKTGLVALQMLTNKQLRQAVDNLITEDFQELGVKDRGGELRGIVEDIINTREGSKKAPAKSSSSSGGGGKERVGLGKVGPLRFRNARPVPLRSSDAAAGTSAGAAAAVADEQQ